MICESLIELFEDVFDGGHKTAMRGSSLKEV